MEPGTAGIILGVGIWLINKIAAEILCCKRNRPRLRIVS